MRDGVTVRRLTKLDAAPIEQVSAHLSREWGLALGYTLTETLDWCHSVAARPDQCILVATQEDAILGMVLIVDNDLETETELTPWLSALYVLPSHRKQGIGDRLIDAALNFAGQIGAKDLYLYAARGLLIDYYGLRGWQASYDFKRDGIDFVVMKRALT